ncbi:MAG: lysostaphin resistance A-like protein [Tepidisphaerales bacterium]
MRRRAGVAVCWVMVLSLAAGLLLLSSRDAAGPAQPAAPQVDLVTQYQARYFVGMKHWLGDEAARPLLGEVESAVDARLRPVVTAVLRAELDGPQRAADGLVKDDSPDALVLLGWYTRGLRPDEDFVRRYGYIGRLALTQTLPPDDPQRTRVLKQASLTVVVVFVGLAVVGGALLVGVALAVLAGVLTASGSLRWTGATPRGDTAGPLYGFTLYLYLLFLLSAGLSGVADVKLPFAANLLPPLLATAAALVLIFSRSSDASAAASDLGLARGRGLLREAASGIVGYVAGLPLLAGGLVLTLLLSQLAGSTPPSHPVVEVVGESPVWVAILAVVVAPVTEELMFRGALLSHCRGFAGPVLSSLITGVVFAAVHPQGWTALPTLTAIGITLALIRQWRGSILAPMVAHALNNGVVMLLLLLAMS